MQFGQVPVSDAMGAILAHSLRTGHGMFKKGRVLSVADVEVLAASGYREITVAELDADDIAEDIAAARIAAALTGSGVRIGAAFTGRANLYAEAHGIARIDAGRVEAVNAVDEAITLATLPPYHRVGPRQMVATVKVIPFAAPARAVEAAEKLLTGEPAIAVSPLVHKRIALISTQFAETRPQILDKSRGAIDARVEPLGSSVVHEARVQHDAGQLADAIRAAHRMEADPILIFGASAITDRRDVVPAAIVAAGGEITQFGMPVDPGNLLLLGKLGKAMVVGLPSCARSPKVNGFDFVLERLLANVPVGSPQIAAMGVGGLLSEIHTRPQPRDRQPAGSHAPRIAAVVLAAGLSSRMGHNKLMADIGGKPLVRRAVDAALGSSVRPIIVVTGSEAENVDQALAGMPVTIVRNLDFRKGLSTSLISGINAVPDDSDGAVVMLGDMPDVTAQTIDRLVAAFDPGEDRTICVATRNGKRGNPVLWSREFFADIRKLEGDVGAKSLIGENADLVCEVEMADDGPLVDIDTPDALAAYRARRT
ncbi:MAG TPA: molybdopterin-binding/glycosyltransferase family 2 protein [Rhizomicrobium sp.]|nr:molybdopterin-binding/glycosyltransferase family 2 protein [Rhizomicrobium sp.]